MKSSKITPKTVESYINELSGSTKHTLQKMRKIVLSIMPKAEEVISYQIPTYKLNGMPFSAIAAFNSHCSYFTMSHAVMKEFKDELGKYDTSGVTIHFEPGKPLPASLIKKLIKGKLKENQRRALSKKK